MTRGRRLRGPWGALALLALLAGAPLVLARGLPEAGRAAWRSPPPAQAALELRRAELDVRGADGSCARVQAALLRMEAAETGAAVSARKALVARGARVRPLDAELPAWRFERLQLPDQPGPLRWNGTAVQELPSGTQQELPRRQGLLELRAGALAVSDQARGASGAAACDSGH